MSDDDLPFEAFYLPDADGADDVFTSTAATASPWDESLQHGGPPAALLARAVERVWPDPGMRIARITVDMLGGIPQGTVRTEAEVVRPGKRVEMVAARLFVDDRLCVTATAWRIRADEGTTPPEVTGARTTPQPVPDLPGPQPAQYFDGVSPTWGYGRAIEWRFVTGGYNTLGPAAVWTRLRVPLVAGEEVSPTGRLLVVVDSANGLSGEMPLESWLFIPPTVTATIQRPPRGPWVLLDAASTIGPDGVGLAQAACHDRDGLLAVVAQPLLVAPR